MPLLRVPQCAGMYARNARGLAWPAREGGGSADGDPSEPPARAAHPAPNEAPPTSMADREPPGTHRRNFSETEFMDSGMGRSHTSDMPFLGVDDELDDETFDDLLTEQFLLSKLHDAQRRLGEIRDYKNALNDLHRDESRGDRAGGDRAGARDPANGGRAGAGEEGKPRPSFHDRLFVASFRLPLRITVEEDGEVQSSLTTGGLGLVSAFRELLGRMPIRWLGAPGQLVDRRSPASPPCFSEEDRQSITDHLNAGPPGASQDSQSLGLLTYVPIFPSEADGADHQEFCNSVLWQLFHYLPLSFEGERVYQPDMFEAYERVNASYADALVEEWRSSGIEEEDAMFWVHDIHLLLVPKLLRERLPNARIGFFLHTPFPAGEVYRTLPVRKELLEGMLGADLVGFHTYDYARHFLSACERLLGLETKPDRVDNRGVNVQVSIYPFGIDTESFRNAMNKSSVRKLRDELRESLGGKRIIVGVDRLDFIKGIPNKLLGIEHFLDSHPEWRGKVVMLQVATPSRTASEEYYTFRSEALEMVGRINGRFGTLEDMPIHYREHTLTFEELCALYSVADVAVLTSLRDGMNLVSYEYVMCQKEHHGALVLSEFTGAAQNLPGAILVNPWSIDEIGNAIHKALEMTEVDREAKHHKMYGFVMLNSSAAWGVRFIDDLVKHAAIRRRAVAKLVVLPTKKVLQSYRSSKRRLMLLDYDGTLRKYESQPELAEPNDRLKQILAGLAADPANVVFLITGRQKKTMMEWFGSAGIGFAVEHGLSIRWPEHLRDKFVVQMKSAASTPSAQAPLRGFSAGEVDTFDAGAASIASSSPSSLPSLSALSSPPRRVPALGSWDAAAKAAANTAALATRADERDDGWDPVLGTMDTEVMSSTLARASAALRRIVAHTPASFISMKESALTWHYRNADPYFTFTAVQDAKSALEDVLLGSPMEVLSGNEAIHVRPRGVHKGGAVAEIARRLRGGGWEPDWIFSIGDDRTDEEMYQAVVEVAASAPGELPPAEVTTVTVGRKTTAAKFYVPGVDAVTDLLLAMTAQTAENGLARQAPEGV